ncbi:MAG: hypothetical protein WKF71_07830 [Pyrinomonadaceae bacterium]
MDNSRASRKSLNNAPNVRIIDDPLTDERNEYFDINNERDDNANERRAREERLTTKSELYRLDSQRHLRRVSADRASARACDDIECAGYESLHGFGVSSTYQRYLHETARD